MPRAVRVARALTARSWSAGGFGGAGPLLAHSRGAFARPVRQAHSLSLIRVDTRVNNREQFAPDPIRGRTRGAVQHLRVEGQRRIDMGGACRRSAAARANQIGVREGTGNRVVRGLDSPEPRTYRTGARPRCRTRA